MKKYCIYCNKSYEDTTSDGRKVTICPHCSKDNDYHGADEEKIHLLHQECHRSIRTADSLRDNALCFLVIGGILLVIAGIFLLLSFKYNVIKQRVFSPGSLEFIVCCASGAVSVFCLINGFIRITKALHREKYYKKYILESQKANQK